MTLVEALRRTRVDHRARMPGDRFECDLEEAGHLLREGDIRVVDAPPIWLRADGRDLHSVPLPPGRWNRVVACLNVWNDFNALRATIGSWYDHVDAVIAVDGAYPTTGAARCASTDGTREFLRDQSKVTLIEARDGGWWSGQNDKRSAYFAQLEDGDLAFVIDADEFVTGAEQLRRIPAIDVGWVQVGSALYARPYSQPRLFGARLGLRYRGRHHWIFAGDELVTTHQYGGRGLVHAAIPMTLRNARGLGHSRDRRQAKRTHSLAQTVVEKDLTSGVAGARSDQTDAARESLRIVTVTGYDAGLAVSRLHSAINLTTPHTSLLFRDRDEGPYGALTQFTREEVHSLSEAVAGADVLHCHLRLGLVRHDQLASAKRLVLHHHGSMYRANPGFHQALAEKYRALTLVATLELLQYGRAEWLPNPMPVARYRRLREELYRPGPVFRVAHSPSKREFKGTDVFLEACEILRAKGVAIEPVLIEGRPHGEGLAMKAQCDAAFDSFWLGIQCSGLEAAAMGMPVIAGDAHVAVEYERIVGHVPYTFADERSLVDVLAALVQDQDYRRAEAARVTRYCLEWHDEPAVALRYLDVLDDHFGWRHELEIEKRARPRPRTPEKPKPEHPEPEPVQTPAVPAPRHPEPEPVETR